MTGRLVLASAVAGGLPGRAFTEEERLVGWVLQSPALEFRTQCVIRSAPNPKPWELYNLDEDYSQAHNLAAQHPDKLKELVDLFDSEARRNQVYPLEPKSDPQPLITSGKTTFVYHAGLQRIPSASAPRLAGRRHRITVDIEIPAAGASGNCHHSHASPRSMLGQTGLSVLVAR